MFNADRLLSDLIGGGLSGSALGGRRRRYRGGYGVGDALGRTVMSPQGLTILGGLAIAAYEHFKEKGATPAGQGVPEAPAAPPGADGNGTATGAGAAGGASTSAVPPPFVPPTTPGAPMAGASPGLGADPAAGVAPGVPAGEDRAKLLITAMVSAAKADGTIDEDERARILERLAERGATDAERGFLEEEMARPLDIDRLAAQVRDPVLAAEVYAASVLAIEPDTPAEKAYLALLAARLNLDPGMIRELESRLGAAGA